MTAQEILSGALSIVETKVNKIVFGTFFKNQQVQANGLYDNTLLLSAAADIVIKGIKKYNDILLSAVREFSGNPNLEVELVLANNVQDRARELSSVKAGSCPVEDLLNPAYTFENYVYSENNSMAYMVAVAVGEDPGLDYNPLFIYGGTGLGKTHLMQAIGHYAHQMHPEMNICYITSENFINQLVTALKNHDSESFRERFRNVDLLMVDDIQFIAGRNSTEMEFFHTFNELKQNNKAIVMVSDRPPREIQNLEERLCSRFEGGMVIDIQKPDFEARYAILQKKAENMKLDVDDAVLRLIAENVDSNVREMEGCLTRISAHAKLAGQRVDLSVAERVLGDILRRHEHRTVTINLIQKTVADYFEITVENLISHNRSRQYNIPRQIAIFLCRDMLSLPYTVIGSSFGKRHHSTVMNAVENIDKQMKNHTATASSVDDIRQMILGND